MECFGGEVIFGDLAGDAMSGFAPTEEGYSGKESDESEAHGAMDSVSHWQAAG